MSERDEELELKRAAVEFAKFLYPDCVSVPWSNCRDAFINGANWQKQRGWVSDWDVKDGRSNSSDLFCELSATIGQLIKGSAHSIFNGQFEHVGRLIVAQLAHVHKFAPIPKPPEEE